MQSLKFEFSIPRYIFGKTIGRMFPSLLWNSGFSCLRFRETADPDLPNDRWVKIRVTYGGICGSDINLINLHDSPSTSPFASFPFTIGHEAVGTISEAGAAVTGFQIGDRVAVDPILSCMARGFSDPCDACRRGDYSICSQMTDGDIAPGLLIGACRDTGGSWSAYLVAHHSQVIKLPDEITDANGVMIEPFSCALHSVMRNRPGDDDTVLVVGAGTIGICVVAAIRALDIASKIVVVCKYDYQSKLALRYGADEVIRLGGKDYKSIYETAEALGARVLKPVIGPPVIQGGADIVFECVGKSNSVNDALRFARSGGKVVLLGLAGLLDRIDWTTVWLNELDVKGSFAYGMEEFNGKRMRTMEVAIELMRSGKMDLSPLVTHRFPLEKYKDALATVVNKGKEACMKAVFEP
ncbi:zinc-dependent alcohol dehydrogenase [Paenibacillus alkalitolerans]|uniref:zinc-dependent alcohol dehydrogenase n=1 Tax=Paenibacillus alkalitolerans TaxID=2799335 RepID=UPI0018F64492|nr:alcohol dehydrogenase catalytic domain-containing protein [Paenibacillus alkalitolerans]